MAQASPTVDLSLPTPSTDDLRGDLVQPGHPLFGLVWVNPQRMSGTPCFTGTRVPVKSLFDHLEAGDTLDTILDDFPGVMRQQAIMLLELSRTRILEDFLGK